MRTLHSFLLLTLIAGNAVAQTWTGASGNNWSTGANWSGGVAPASAPTTVVTFGFGNPISVIDAPWTINRLDFGLFAPNFSFSGQPLTFSGTAPAISRPASPAVMPNTFANPIVATGSLDIGNAGFLDFTGGVSATGPVMVAGLGFSSLAGSNTFTSGLTVGAAQVLQLRGGSVLGSVTARDSGIFTGGGTVSGPVSTGGLPGGGVAPSPQYGTLRTGTFTNSGFLLVTIGGAAQGTQYSHLDVTGGVVLAGGSLDLGGTFVPPDGAVFTIITNDGTDAVSGTFPNLPEGAVVVFNGVRLQISYVGGTGNDVTLTALAGVPTASENAPTLSGWALILLALLLPLAAANRLRRR